MLDEIHHFITTCDKTGWPNRLSERILCWLGRRLDSSIGRALEIISGSSGFESQQGTFSLRWKIFHSFELFTNQIIVLKMINMYLFIYGLLELLYLQFLLS